MVFDDTAARLRRSPLHDLLAQDGAGAVAPWRGGEVVRSAAGPARDARGGLWLFDASPAERRRLLRSRAPAKDGALARGRAKRLAGGWLAFRAGPSDLCLLPPLSRDEAPAPAVPAGWRDAAPEPGFQEGFWLHLSGSDAGKLFTRGCEVDLRPSRFGDLAVAQVLLFRTSVTIVREDTAAEAGYHILGCNTLAHHLYAQIRDLQARHGGGLLGLEDLPPSAPV